MSYDTYHSLGLDTPFEQKPRTKHDSGMQNINGGLSREQMWQRNFAAEATARPKYSLSAVSQARADAPPGTYIEHKAWNASRVYPGTVRDWWMWAPAQHDGGSPSSLVIFNDGVGFLHPSGSVRATLVLGNLIADGLLEPTVAVFLSPGIRPGHPDCAYDDHSQPKRATSDDPQRSLEYDTVSDTYSRFLLEDVLPVVEAQFRITQDPSRRALVGCSSGAVAAFSAAWFRPDKFGLVATMSGSFVNIRGAHNLPWLIRNTARKPIKVFLQSGEHDMNNNHGSWPLGNQAMAAALEYAGYDYKFVFGTDAHGITHGGSIFHLILQWLFRGTPSSFAEEFGQRPGPTGLLMVAGSMMYPVCLVLLYPTCQRLARLCSRGSNRKSA